MRRASVWFFVLSLAVSPIAIAGLIGSSFEQSKKIFDSTREVRPYDEEIDGLKFKTISFKFNPDKGATEERVLTARFFQGKCVAVLLSTEKGKRFEKGKQQTLWESEFGTEKFETIKPQEGFYQGERGNVMMASVNEKGRDTILLMDGRFYEKVFSEKTEHTAQAPKKEGLTYLYGSGNRVNLYTRGGLWLGQINGKSAWDD
jgi:hypothetical protein